MHLPSLLKGLIKQGSPVEEGTAPAHLDITSIRDAVWGGDDSDQQDPQGFYYPEAVPGGGA